MSWDAAWEKLFRTRGWNKYPAEQVIRFVARNFFGEPDRKRIKLLELGCAEGNNVWFMAREGFDAYGIDGSQSAIEKAGARLRADNLEGHVLQGDVAFLTDAYPDVRFDAILDPGCLTCNRMNVVDSVLDQAKTLLRPGGKVFSVVLAEGTYGSESGREVEPGTFTDIKDGALQGIGLCHFFTLDEVQELFARFSNVHVEYVMASQAATRQVYKHWVIDGETAK